MSSFLFNYPEEVRQEGEYATFIWTSLNSARLGIAITGSGAERAAAGTRALCDAMKPDWLISAGYGGTGWSLQLKSGRWSLHQ
ncbi:MAG: hypothetical protein R3C11_06260 [Planctomycetaceae bacterium]